MEDVLQSSGRSGGARDGDSLARRGGARGGRRAAARGGRDGDDLGDVPPGGADVLHDLHDAVR